MASISEVNPYCCDQCGAANIVAAPVLYDQGTRMYSGKFHSRISQSYSAQSFAPPNLRGYTRALLVWGFGILFACFWGSAGIRAAAQHPSSIGALGRSIGLLAILALVCATGMIINFRRITRYNRTIYPQLRWNWEHTYICRRCGKSQLIQS